MTDQQQDELPVRRFIVAGRGEFPRDMLRKDGAWAASPEDQAKIDATFEDGRPMREVVLESRERYLTPDRWRSFGWEIIAPAEEMTGLLDRYMRIFSVTMRLQRDRKTVGEVEFLLDNLDAQGSFFGISGGFIAQLTANAPELSNEHPGLFSAMHGNWAMMAPDADRMVEGGNHRHSLAWFGPWSVEIERTELGQDAVDARLRDAGIHTQGAAPWRRKLLWQHFDRNRPR